MKCVVCDKELSGGLDTYGMIGCEMCWDCWKVAGDESEWAMTDAIYGLGPHIHTYDPEGHLIIGGTKFLALPEPDGQGLIKIDGMYFRPDPESPGLGTWFRDCRSACHFEMLKEGLE